MKEKYIPMHKKKGENFQHPRAWIFLTSVVGGNIREFIWKSAQQVKNCKLNTFWRKSQISCNCINIPCNRFLAFIAQSYCCVFAIYFYFQMYEYHNLTVCSYVWRISFIKNLTLNQISTEALKSIWDKIANEDGLDLPLRAVSPVTVFG